eukprot:3934132-Rhodomonas_salina.5
MCRPASDWKDRAPSHKPTHICNNALASDNDDHPHGHLDDNAPVLHLPDAQPPLIRQPDGTALHFVRHPAHLFAGQHTVVVDRALLLVGPACEVAVDDHAQRLAFQTHCLRFAVGVDLEQDLARVG